jgi:hypothetical protein
LVIAYLNILVDGATGVGVMTTGVTAFGDGVSGLEHDAKRIIIVNKVINFFMGFGILVDIQLFMKRNFISRPHNAYYIKRLR